MNEEKTIQNLQVRGKQKENISQQYTVGLNTVDGRPKVKTKMITSYIHYHDNNLSELIKDIIFL